MADRTIIEIANDVLTCALSWAPNARLMGNVRADEIVRLARYLAACHAREDELFEAIKESSRLRGTERQGTAIRAILHAARARRAAEPNPASEVCPSCKGSGTFWYCGFRYPCQDRWHSLAAGDEVVEVKDG